MVRSVEQATGAKIYYHTAERVIPDVTLFTLKKNIAMGVVGLAALTALVIATLGILHAQGVFNAGPMGTILTQGVYPFVGIGGTLLLADAIALIVLAVKRHQANKLLHSVKPMVDAIREQSDLGWWENIFDEKLGGDGCRFTEAQGEGAISYVLQVDGDERTVHVFLDNTLANVYKTRLRSEGYTPKSIRVDGTL